MNLHVKSITLFLLLTVPVPPLRADDITKPPTETKLAGPDKVSIIVRMQGPYDADVTLQVVCYFKRTAESEKRMAGAPVELDRRLGGLIGSLRARGEFVGDDLETLLVEAPEGTIKPKQLLLIGIGDESTLSLEKMERVGKVALREAVKLRATRVAFAPLIRDQGNNTIKTGDVETAVICGMLLAYDTERRLQKQGFASSYALEEWVVEAGPTYFAETVAGVKKAIAQAAEVVKARDSKSYSTKSK